MSESAETEPVAALSREAARQVSAAVVIPTHHRLDRLGLALASVENQTWPADELRVVAADPAERGAVAALLREAVRSDGTRVLAADRRLLGGAARNLGWRDTTADIIFFLDDDDSWSPAKIERHMQVHAALGADVVYSGATYVHGDRQIWSPAVPPSLDMARSLISGAICPPSTSCVSISRPALEAVGGFDGELPSYQDWELWLRLARAGKTFASVPEGLTFFVQHEGERVSMNVEGRLRAATMVLARHPEEPGLAQFFEAEARHMIERKIVFAAMQGRTEAFQILRAAVTKGPLSLMSWRAYWILAKTVFCFARRRLIHR